MYDSVWATAYDEPAEAIMGISATEFASLKEEELQELIKKLRYKEFKLRLVTKNEEYNNETRKKTGIIKVLNLNYGE
jgi:ribosomal protein L29